MKDWQANLVLGAMFFGVIAVFPVFAIILAALELTT